MDSASRSNSLSKVALVVMIAAYSVSLGRASAGIFDGSKVPLRENERLYLRSEDRK